MSWRYPGEGLGLHRRGVCFQPFDQVLRDGRGRPVDVLAAPGADPGLVAGRFGVLFGGEAADPPGLGHASSGIRGRGSRRTMTLPA